MARAVLLILMTLAVSGGAGAQGGFLGFRILDLDGSMPTWTRGPDGIIRVTYAFVTEPMRFPGARNCTGMVPLDDLLADSRISEATLRQEARAAFDMWEKAASIEFREVADARAAGILIGAQEHPEGHAYANVSQRPGADKVRAIERSLICLNPAKRWKVGFDGNLKVYDLRFTIAHEIGHAIGLDHPDDETQIMSFRYSERFRTLQRGDIAGAVKIYGVRAATN